MTAPGFESLRAHAARLQARPLADLLRQDPSRIDELSLRVGPLYANFARQGYDRGALTALVSMAESARVPGALRALFDGEAVNITEQRPALHTALRSDLSTAAVAREAHAMARDARGRMAAVVEGLHDSHVTDIVSVGIGGSDLGPRLVADALAPPGGGRFRVHFLSNVDGAAAQRVLAGLDPAHAAVLLISKSFGTQETLLNGAILRDWLGDDARTYAITANIERAQAFGIPAGHILPMWDWVGGRYSLWSAVGLPIALAIGMEGFGQLLEGAAEFDAHALHAPPGGNLAILHGLTAVWNRNALGSASQAVLAYDDRLRLFPAYLQQLVMESLGKSATLGGGKVAEDTVPVWWGGAGTDVQHSFFQALHQGTEIVPADFIGVIRGDNPHSENQAALLANLLAQTEALANGFGHPDPHRAYAGGRPSTLLLLDALTPHALGMLIALYEHSVYVQSVLWGINAFDQFGVELGKQVAGRLLPALRGEQAEVEDPVTQALLDEIRSHAR